MPQPEDKNNQQSSSQLPFGAELLNKIKELEQLNQPVSPPPPHKANIGDILKIALLSGVGSLGLTRTPQPPSGGTDMGTRSWKGTAAVGLKSLAKAIEEQEKARQLLQQANEAKKQEQFGRTLTIAKLMQDYLNTKRQREYQKQRLQLMGMPKPLSEIDKMRIKEIRARIDKTRAQIKAILGKLKKGPGNEKQINAWQDVDKVFSKFSNLKTPLGQQAAAEIIQAWNNGDINKLQQIREGLNYVDMSTYQEQREDLTPEGESLGFVTTTTRPAPDYGILQTAIGTLIDKAQELGVQNQTTKPQSPQSKTTTQYPLSRAGALQAYADGNYNEAARIANEIGMSIEEFR